jgi:hypothetical protein
VLDKRRTCFVKEAFSLLERFVVPCAGETRYHQAQDLCQRQHQASHSSMCLRPTSTQTLQLLLRKAIQPFPWVVPVGCPTASTHQQHQHNLQEANHHRPLSSTLQEYEVDCHRCHLLAALPMSCQQTSRSTGTLQEATVGA